MKMKKKNVWDLWDTINIVLKGKFKVLNAYISKAEKFQINNSKAEKKNRISLKHIENENTKDKSRNQWN